MMSFRRQLQIRGLPAARWLLVFATLAGAGLAPARHALAAKKEHVSRLDGPAEGGATGNEKSYVLSYFLVGLAVGLGVMVICRAENRGDKPKKKKVEEDEE